MDQSIIEAIWSFEFSYYTLDKNGTSDIPRVSAENNAFPTPCRSPGHHLQKIERQYLKSNIIRHMHGDTNKSMHID